MASLEQQIALIVDGLGLTTTQLSKLTSNIVSLRSQSLLELDSDISKLKDGSHLTKDGFDLLAKAAAGKELCYTKVAFGDSFKNGQLIETTREEEYNFTALVHPVGFEVSLADCSFTGGGTATVKCRVQNQDLTTGFWMREMGLFARDPDTGAEKLYCYRNTGVLSEFIPPADSAMIWDVIMSIVTVVGEATNVTAIIDTSLAFITQHEYETHVNSTTPHPNTPCLKSDVTTTNYFWTTSGTDKHLHRIDLKSAQNLILGGDASTLPQMERRILQSEVNIANLYMQLNGETELGLIPNLMLVEDFANYAECDQYEVKVIAEVAGVHGVQIETDNNILTGHWYTITDGSKSEYVRIKSVAKNSDVIIAIFESKLANTYDLTNTRLMRTTAWLTENQARGAGEIHSLKVPYSLVWQGSGANVATTTTLPTTQANADLFDLSGEYGFTSAGEFTINVN